MNRSYLRPWLIIPLLCAGVGCGGSGSSAAPSADLAQKALARSLTAWKDGKRPGILEGTEPLIQAVDSKWQAGQKLGSFEIVREEPAETERRFAVRLHHGSPGAAEDARYMVVGTGPIWVYREEDYQRMINMDNSPTTRPASRRAR
jgi:hypothetical protein